LTAKAGLTQLLFMFRGLQNMDSIGKARHDPIAL